MKRLVILGITVSLSSCSFFAPSPEVARIDSALTELESIAPILDSFDTQALENRTQKAGSNLSFIEKNYPDSMEFNLALFMGDYRSNKKRLSKLNREIPYLIENAEYTTSQLQNLRSDVRHGYIAENGFDTTFTVENKAVTSIVESADYLNELYQTAMKEDKARSPRVDSIVLSLKKRGYK